ncbi:hypothetical protein NDU88_001195 [Pleurodeles waltl]|uniref:Uncharacterized protein n=1 Tax=Pleurodeles waltl TaxID=8319 RepID=A0AAV7P6A4_PLEWA|nr:hypothetical protein NDU88_001195 [Pleurodeles waltl]
MEGPRGHSGGAGRAQGGYSGQPPTGQGRGSPEAHSCTEVRFLLVLRGCGFSAWSRRRVRCYRQSWSGGASGFSLHVSLWGYRGVVLGYSRGRSRLGVLPVVLVLWISSRGRRVQRVKSHASGVKSEVFGSCRKVAILLLVVEQSRCSREFLGPYMQGSPLPVGCVAVVGFRVRRQAGGAGAKVVVVSIVSAGVQVSSPSGCRNPFSWVLGCP